MQANPSEFPDGEPEIPAARAVERTVQALEQNKAAVSRWFWKGLLAFNLVLWSVALCAAFLMRVA